MAPSTQRTRSTRTVAYAGKCFAGGRDPLPPHLSFVETWSASSRGPPRLERTRLTDSQRLQSFLENALRRLLRLVLQLRFSKRALKDERCAYLDVLPSRFLLADNQRNAATMAVVIEMSDFVGHDVLVACQDIDPLRQSWDCALCGLRFAVTVGLSGGGEAVRRQERKARIGERPEDELVLVDLEPLKPGCAEVELSSPHENQSRISS